MGSCLSSPSKNNSELPAFSGVAPKAINRKGPKPRNKKANKRPLKAQVVEENVHTSSHVASRRGSVHSQAKAVSQSGETQSRSRTSSGAAAARSSDNSNSPPQPSSRRNSVVRTSSTRSSVVQRRATADTLNMSTSSLERSTTTSDGSALARNPLKGKFDHSRSTVSSSLAESGSGPPLTEKRSRRAKKGSQAFWGPRSPMFHAPPLAQPVKPLSASKVSRIEEWIDGSDHGTSSLGRLLDPMDVIGHERRRGMADMGCDFRSPLVIARDSKQAVETPVAVDPGASTSNTSTGSSVVDHSGGSSIRALSSCARSTPSVANAGFSKLPVSPQRPL